MKTNYLSMLAIGAMLTFAVPGNAQLQIPRPSPSATITQTVGLTDITIEYSSPGVKGRAIWGGLVPYDKMWRTGANSATRISFSRDVTVEGTKVPKGKYSVFTIPGATEFTVIFNKDLEASVEDYKMEQDQVRFKVKTQACPHRERLTFMFSNFDDTKASIDMEWEKVRISINVGLETDKQARESINNTIGGTWRTYNSAARYHLDTKSELATGMKYVDQSLALKEEWYNSWTKAQLYFAMGNQTEAHRWAIKTKELGDKNPDSFFYKEEVDKAVVDWKVNAGNSGKK